MVLDLFISDCNLGLFDLDLNIFIFQLALCSHQFFELLGVQLLYVFDLDEGLLLRVEMLFELSQ